MTNADYFFSIIKSLLLAGMCYRLALHWVAYIWLVAALMDVIEWTLKRYVQRLESVA